MAVAGAVAGSIDVLSIPVLIVALAVYGWFAAALGVWISLQLRSTWRAQFLTIASLLLINVTGQGVLNALSRFGFAPQVWPGFTPYEISKLLLDPQFIQRLAVHVLASLLAALGHRRRPRLADDLQRPERAGLRGARGIPDLACPAPIRGRRRPRHGRGAPAAPARSKGAEVPLLSCSFEVKDVKTRK